VILLLILSCPFDSCPNFECYDFSLVERRRSEDVVVGVGWLLLDILCSFFLHSPVHVSFLAPPIPLMAYHASMGVGGVVRLVFLSFSLSLSSIHDDFFDLDDSFLSCDEWLEYSGIDWRVLGRRGGFFFFFFSTSVGLLTSSMSFNTMPNSPMPCKLVFLVIVTKRVGTEC
jgi:hypothetical protein